MTATAPAPATWLTRQIRKLERQHAASHRRREAIGRRLTELRIALADLQSDDALARIAPPTEMPR
jgi:hypothetical protein